MSPSTGANARRVDLRLLPDRSRVITRLFVPGQEGFDHQDSRTAAVVARVLALDDHEVQASLAKIVATFGMRHRGLSGVFGRHAAIVADRLDPEVALSDDRRRLLGATFTSEYAIEGAALCNPSMVAHPDQTGVASGSLRFAMSVRAVGEGHRSSIGFRTGTIGPDGQPTLDSPPRFAITGTPYPTELAAATFHSELHRLDCHGENADFVLDALGEHFSPQALEGRLQQLHANITTRIQAERTIGIFRSIAERSYGVEFAHDTLLSERVLWPATSAERQGMEDARFVVLVHDDGRARYHASYTAYDGERISQQLLSSEDLRRFTSVPLTGAGAANKGLALFPRQVGGRFAALSRCDRESNSVVFSDELTRWSKPVPVQLPTHAWEVLQLGNCGSPIETDYGWLVLTHGVGPMRIYSIGALLLDLDDPTTVVSQLRRPLLSPTSDEQDGYVPNVVYSCGALVHAGHLVIPYGIADATIGLATIPLVELFDQFGQDRKYRNR